MNQEKSYYSDAELSEFKELILRKLDIAREKMHSFKQQMSEFSSEHKVKSYEDYSDSSELEHLAEMISREEKHVLHLENALVRIKNKVYGICRETGRLIAKERLMMVPHATLSMEGKLKTAK